MKESEIFLDTLKELTLEVRQLRIAIQDFHNFDQRLETARLERNRSLLDVRQFLSKRNDENSIRS